MDEQIYTSLDKKKHIKIREFSFSDIEEMEEEVNDMKNDYDFFWYPVLRYDTENGTQTDEINREFLELCTKMRDIKLLSVHGDRKVLCYVDTYKGMIFVDFTDWLDVDGRRVLSNEMLYAIIGYVGATWWGVMNYKYDWEESCLCIQYTSKKKE